MKNYDEQTAKLSHGGYTTVHTQESTSKNNFMYVMYILYSLLSRPTNEQHTHIIYIYIYINYVLYISTPTCFIASASSSGSLNLVLC